MRSLRGSGRVVGKGKLARNGLLRHQGQSPRSRLLARNSFRVARRPSRWKIVYDAAQMRRYPVGTKLNNSQNEGAESAPPVTLVTLIQAQLFQLQLLLNT